MPVYAYKGVTAAGKATRGHLDAESSRSARAKLRRDGVFLTDFQETSAEALTRSATPAAKSACVLMPVPTAVPPIASSDKLARVPTRRRMPCSTWLA